MPVTMTAILDKLLFTYHKNNKIILIHAKQLNNTAAVDDMILDESFLLIIM